VGEVAATVGGNATVLEGRGAVTLEVCAGVEAVGVGVGELVGEDVLVDP
jgi:hypothetical protein